MLILPAKRSVTIRLLLSIALATAIVLAWGSAAEAHAGLISTAPTPGEVVASSPSQIVLRFSESVEIPAHAVRVFDANRREIAVGSPHRGASGSEVITPVPTLPAGGYVVAWRVVSADGHPVSAAFTFAVGHGSVDADVAGAIALLAPRGASRTNGVLYGVTRGVVYGSLALVIGALALAVLTWRETIGDRRVRRMLVAAAAVAVTGSLLLIGFQGVNERGGTVADLGRWSTWRDEVVTHTGGWLLARAFAAALLLGVAWSMGVTRRPSRPIAAALVGTGVIAAVVTVAMSGHAPTGRLGTLGVVADVVHVGAMSMWLGGLAFVVVGVLPSDDEESAGRVVDRFSSIAFVSVAALVGTGVVMGWRQGVELTDPTATSYGTILVFKIGFVAVLVALAASSRRVLRGRHLRTLVGGWRTALRVRIVAELVVAVTVLTATSLLVDAAPPRAIANGPLELQRSVAGLSLDAVLDPAKVGPTQLHVYVSSATSVQPNIDELTVTLSQPVLGNAPITVKMLRAGPAHFQSDAMVIPFAGDWVITFGVQTDAFTRDSVTGAFSVR